MTYLQMAYVHLVSIVPAFFIGTFLLVRRKGSPLHKRLGKIYMALMLFSAIVTLFMPAEVGPQFLGHFGFIHLFSLLVLITVPSAYWSARNGQVLRHKRNMIGLYVGGLLIAGSFTFAPGRLLHSWLFL